MDTSVTIEEAEARLAALIRRVELGETIVVTRDGKSVLDLVPHKRKPGSTGKAVADSLPSAASPSLSPISRPTSTILFQRSS